MAGNRYDSGQGADPRGGWTPPPPPPAPGGNAHGRADGPEYFTAPHPGTGPAAHGGPGGTVGDGYGQGEYGQGGYGGYGGSDGGGHEAHDPYAADQPGSTRAFPTGDPYGQEQPYYDEGGYGQEQPAPYGPGAGARPGPGQDNVAVYRAGGQSSPRATGPRPQWRELLFGIVRTPTAIFDRTRDHQVWLPALVVSLLYGALAVLAIGLTRDDIVDSTFGVALTGIAVGAVSFTIVGAVFGGVTYALARQLGGDGPWRSTIGLAALIGWLTDAPRLLLDLVLPSGSAFVQAVGWATWALCAYLLTAMVRRVHDLPWGKAAGAAGVQLLALLVLIKLPTLG
ncbi:Yip1 family protein [Streptomyces sp. NRRL WC-3742]|uniref:Yip1 family protein n=1 Tax=Streptomyces sp. NRRL WC-3742 TaxID=1463934 RepID=UPI00068BAC0B|nr:Yip1 family protein [Streptomyces sp. NRRL WC-3742]